MGQAPHWPESEDDTGGAGSSRTWHERLGSLHKWLCSLSFFRKSAAAGHTGQQGEDLAARHLAGLGYRILVRNFRVRGGEADLIVAKDGWVAVVEVKARRSLRFGSPAEAVRGDKGRRVIRAGRIYCRRKGLSLGKLRGDVVTVEWPGGGGDPQIRHWVGCLVDSEKRR